MKRLLIKKLIVVSDVEKSSREINFNEGLNIIIGGNKTGKSSLIKSIFHTFGCEVVFEDDWKKLISEYIVEFTYGSDEYCIIRTNKLFSILNFKRESNIKIIETDNFHEYSNKLMDILGVTMDCLTKSGKRISITPPLLFRFQYIDQDLGWGKIGESFTNMKYIENWKGNTNKYVVGFQGEEYYSARQELNIVKDKIEATTMKLKHFRELLNSIDIYNEENERNDVQESNNLKENVKRIFDEMNLLEKNRIELESKIYILKNQRYETHLELVATKNVIKESDKDHEFALEQCENILCPFCGHKYENTTLERIEIIKDIQTGNQLLTQIRSELKLLDEEIAIINEKKAQDERRYLVLKKAVENMQETASIIMTYRNEGKKELIENGKKEKERIEDKLSFEYGEKIAFEKKIKGFESKKRRKEITDKIKEYLENILKEVNVPLSTIKFADFVQTLNKLGSELPRIIYAYHVALYLYNLERGKSIFNILVIDTPNQQGQEQKNLQNIDSVLGHLLQEKGQVILGTERKTGYEAKAATVVTLKFERNCLLPSSYNEHVSYYDYLREITVKE